MRMARPNTVERTIIIIKSEVIPELVVLVEDD